MRITDLKVFKADLPLKDTDAYRWSDGKSLTKLDTTVVELVTDAGVLGYGECCPFGSSYLPSYSAGVRVGINELAPRLIGLDPLEIECVNAKMDFELKGHPYVKSAIDMALWDIAGKFSGLPVCCLLGGRFGDSVPLYRPINQAEPDKMAEEVTRCKRELGYSRFQLKVGGSCVAEDVERIRAVRGVLEQSDLVIADANTGWTVHEAVRVCHQVSDLDVYIEQPCRTLSECQQVRLGSACGLPLIADESVDSIESLLNARSFADCVKLKISKLGGITKTKLARDLCCELGISMIIEDCWGSDFVTSAIAHLAQSTQPKWRFMSTIFDSCHSVNVGFVEGDRPMVDGRGGLTAPTAPGLGVKPDFSVLTRVA